MDEGREAKDRNGEDHGNSGSGIGCWEHDSEEEDNFGIDDIEDFVGDENCDTVEY
jgi:hypothetical protein